VEKKLIEQPIITKKIVSQPVIK